MNVKIQPLLLQNTVDECVYQFRYGDELIGFERIDRKHNARRILIKVHPDCRVVVQAPSDASDEEVMQAAKKRSRWIYKKLSSFREQLSYVRPRQYISGESHYYMGRRYMLKVITDLSCKPHVKLLRGRLDVHIKEYNQNKVKTLVNDWYKVRAEIIFQHQLMAVKDKAHWVDETPPIRVFRMQTQWGSCSPNGRLTLNPHLVKAPRECIDYVILHELCHLHEHNHSEKFYRLMNQVMPDWGEVKIRLDNLASAVLAN